MKVYVLTRPENQRPFYDAVRSVCVVAEGCKEARALASAVAGDETGAVWLDPTRTLCEEADLTEAAVLCRDMVNG